MGSPIRRVAIVNRGEAGVRFLATAAEYVSDSSEPIEAVAFYTDADAASTYVRRARHAHCLGPAVEFDVAAARTRHAYLDHDRLRTALVECGADAAWVGWGFVAEDPSFADLCTELGITFIGPPSDVMRALGDKISAKQLAERADIPVAPWSGGPVDDVDGALAVARAIGFPVMVKAAAGGGGRGIRSAATEDELRTAFAEAAREAELAFGDGRVFIEIKISGARHVEVQIAADHHGTVWALGVRDCTVQRRNQKVLEESASPVLSDDVQASIAAAAVRLSRVAGYRNVGTVEFLYLPASGAFYFMEVNARLQVEHTVTEAVTGVDLVALQLDIASGARLDSTAPTPRGHAIEVRVNAEDPDRRFQPSSGRIAVFRPASGPGIRVDAGVAEGEVIAPEFDSMIAKIVAWGADRGQAFARLRRGLRSTELIVEGGMTNRPFLIELSDDARVLDGSADTTYLDHVLRERATSVHTDAAAAVLFAAANSYLRQLDAETATFFAAAQQGRAEGATLGARGFELHHLGHTYRLDVSRTGPQEFRVTAADGVVDLTVAPVVPGRSVLVRDDTATNLTWVASSEQHMISTETGNFRISNGEVGTVTAATSGVVVAVQAKVGTRVVAGDTLVVVEAMKLESAVCAPTSGRIAEVLVGPNSQVHAGQPLVRLDADSLLDTSHADVGRIAFGARPARRVPSWPDDLVARLLGFDLGGGAEISVWDDELVAAVEATSSCVDVIDVFTDLLTITRSTTANSAASGEELFLRVCRSPDRASDVATEEFLRALCRLLARLGVDDLSHSESCRSALYQLFRAGAGLDNRAAEVAVVLRAMLESTPSRAGRTPQALSRIDALIVACADRYTEVEAFARAVRERRTATRVLSPTADLATDLSPRDTDVLELWRLSNFDLEHVVTVGNVELFQGTARAVPDDRRLFALAEVTSLEPSLDPDGVATRYPALEQTLERAFAAIRRTRLVDVSGHRLLRNRVTIYVGPVWEIPDAHLHALGHRFAPAARGLGLETIVIRARARDDVTGEVRDSVLHMNAPHAVGLSVGRSAPSPHPVRPHTEYERNVLRTQQRGELPPYDIAMALTAPHARRGDLPLGRLVEYDLNAEDRLAPVDRAFGANAANIVVGVITNWTDKHPEGFARVILLSDPARGLGSLAEPECRRIIAALDLAASLDIPMEWFTVSSGARVAMDSGTENMDWTGAALRAIVEFTDAGHELNVVTTGVSVGAQSYFNAEATMLMHTKGILIMLPGTSMVLTGKQALDVSGGVSAEDNVGIGGYERIMGPNGQAQYFAADIFAAAAVLFAHYDHTYVAPGERGPRSRPTVDPIDRDVCASPHPALTGSGFVTVGDIFSARVNPDRKKPFDIRTVMRAVADQDSAPLERWRRWRGAESSVVWDAHLGGRPVCLLGIESHNVTRHGAHPEDGPQAWTAGTLFPQSSKKIAHAINAASGNRPLVVLANLSGFDGSPDSMRNGQLEYGAEIGRAVTHFDGPIVFCVISRYHGGAFVVFSKRLNESIEACAVEGARASVLGGAPAAAVVFARDVERRVEADRRMLERVGASGTGLDDAGSDDAMQVDDLRAAVHAEKLGEVAAEFDAVHTVDRAQKVGSIDHIITPDRLRPYLVAAVERGVRRHHGAASSPDTDREGCLGS